MDVKERVLASRLIQKIDGNKDYAKKIGLSYVSVEDYVIQNTRRIVSSKENK